MERLSRTELVAARERLGLSQERLAERIGVSRDTVARWERGTSGIYARNLVQLAEALDVDIGVARTLIGHNPAEEQAATATAEISPESSAREGGGVDPAIGLPGLGGESQSEFDDLWKLQRALHPPSADGELISLLERRVTEMDQTLGCWTQHRLWAETGRRLEAVTGWLAEPQPVDVRRRLVTMAGRLAGLRGCVLFDNMNHRSALSWFRAAEGAAREADDVELAAWVLAHQSLVAHDRRSYDTARDVLVAAAKLAKAGGSVTLRAWIAALLARSHASLGDQPSFIATYRATESLLDASSPTERRHGMDFAAGTLDTAYYYGSSLLLLGLLDDAGESYTGALARLPEGRVRARAMLTLSVATVSARSGHIDEAARLTTEALSLMNADPAGRVTRRATEVRSLLGPVGGHVGLAELDECMASVLGAPAPLPGGQA